MVPLDFTDTILLHKHSAANTGGVLTVPISGAFNQDKTLINTTDDGTALEVTNKNSVAQSVLVTNLVQGAVTILECWRPLIYEPISMLQSMCNNTTTNQGSRHNRQVQSLIVAGSFRIRMIEGVNIASHWAHQIKMVEQEGPDDDGEINYGKDGFASPQFVRAICIVVTDMGQGYGQGKGSRTISLQDASNPNFREDDAAGVGAGAADTLNSHLLAPSLGDIFDDVGRDPEGNYSHVIQTFNDYNNEDMIRWKYKQNKATHATPEFGGTLVTSDAAFVDPLRGSFRRRKFHVVHDKKIQFQARGSQSGKFNQEGGRQHEFRWSIKLKNLRMQQDATNTFANQSRVREQMSKRVFWYFIPSISNMTNGTSHVDSDITRGHHGFTVLRGPEKAFWTEKDDQ